jgi:hypothetical protein
LAGVRTLAPCAVPSLRSIEHGVPPRTRTALPGRPGARRFTRKATDPVPSSQSTAALADPPAPSWPSPVPAAAVPSILYAVGRATGNAALEEGPSAIRNEPVETERLPLVQAQGSPAGLEYVRASVKSVAPVPDPETIRRQVEEKVERTIVERTETLVARELSADSAPFSRLRERVFAELSEALVLERERLGWS